MHFFTGVNLPRGKYSSKSKEEAPPQKICKLCSYVRTFLYLFCILTISSDKYGTDTSMIPNDVPNYIYGPKTGNTNLRRHLYSQHAKEYDDAVVKHKWAFKLTTQIGATTHDARKTRNSELPPFSPAAFLEHLVRFVVADDQVSPEDLWLFHTHKSSVDSCRRMP